MDKRLNQDELTQLVAEIDRLSQRQEQELSQEQVKEVLQDMNLSPELLDEALIQVQRRQALEVQQQRTRNLVIGAIVVGVVLFGSLFFLWRSYQQSLGRVVAVGDRINLKQDDGTDLNTISRATNPELFYRVTLNHAPTGRKLPLSCNWVAPSGKVVQQNHYQTREITDPTWTTHCRYSLAPTAPGGTWKVEMRLEGREISEETFEVK